MIRVCMSLLCFAMSLPLQPRCIHVHVFVYISARTSASPQLPFTLMSSHMWLKILSCLAWVRAARFLPVLKRFVW